MAVIQSEVISRLECGETIIHVLPKGDSESEQPYQYLSGGGWVTGATYNKLKPKLRPVSSGLFPDAEPQEWERDNG